MAECASRRCEPERILSMKMFMKLADNRQADSLATKLRRMRFALFMCLVSSLPRPIKILDVGGSQIFWESMGFTEERDITVVILNLSEVETIFENFTSVAGDARSMKSF